MASSFIENGRAFEPFALLAWALLLALSLIAATTFHKRRRNCYLLDYACYKPPEERKLSTEVSVYVMGLPALLDIQKLRFQWRIHLRSGLGEETYGPQRLFNEQSFGTFDEALLEMEEAFVPLLDQLFAKGGVTPQDIGILIVCVSTFSPAPSHAAWIVNRYKMKENIKTFNLSGMGCSSSGIAVALAKDLFAIYPNSYALLVGTESISVNACYAGTEKSMSLTDCLFRVGGSAVLLSNRAADAARAKMRLVHVVRTTYADDDKAYSCCMTKEDSDGFYGISIRQSLLDVASEAIRRNLSSLAPKVLPLSELIQYSWATAKRRLAQKFKSAEKVPTPYVPNFGKAFEHFCIHPGGRAVITGVGKNLRLSEENLEASRMALHRFGNTSTSGVWYEVAYLEAKRQLRRGDRLWQLSLGSGFKCNSAVWEVLHDSDDSVSTVWDDVIHRYPCGTLRNYTDKDVERYLASICQ
eukprot:TRINITY_DN19549_c0_g1_i1.p1 TRINITY_DN19549_c0_g1~~TRINITY_DN19549_c0_g1_i1.p1  ORF type:complete len:469 (-),score=-37.40 TRINITY_DN19549_c0_g1_i1:137-1543(-)